MRSKLFKYIRSLDQTVWVTTFVIVSSMGAALYTIADSKNDIKINIALQHGVTMMQDLINNVSTQDSLIHNLIVKQEDCAYPVVNGLRCENAISMYDGVKIKFQQDSKIAFDSQERYKEKVNDLENTYNFYENLQLFSLLTILGGNIIALILNHKTKKKMKPTLAHIQINVSKSKESFAFYKALLVEYFNYEILDEGETHLGISNGGTDMWFIQTESSYTDAKFHRKNTGINHLAFRLESKEAIDEFSEKFLKVRGIPTLYDSPKSFPEYSAGYYAVYFEDPDRIKIEVLYKE